MVQLRLLTEILYFYQSQTLQLLLLNLIGLLHILRLHNLYMAQKGKAILYLESLQVRGNGNK